jgi:hypothetical protein
MITRSLRKPRKQKAVSAGDGVERLLRKMRADLVEHVGGHPSATQNILIERACWSRLHLRLLDEKAAGGTALTAPDRQAFISLSNVLIQALDALGPPAPDGKPLDLANLSDEDLARVAGIAARRVERIVIEPARQTIAAKLGQIFRREAVSEAEAVPVPDDVAADPLPAPISAEAVAEAAPDALDEPPTPHSPPDLRVVVSTPGAASEWPPADCWKPPPSRLSEDEERAEQKRKFHQVLG